MAQNCPKLASRSHTFSHNNCVCLARILVVWPHLTTCVSVIQAATNFFRTVCKKFVYCFLRQFEVLHVLADCLVQQRNYRNSLFLVLIIFAQKIFS